MKEAVTIFFIGLNLKFTTKIKTLKPIISVTTPKVTPYWLYGKKIQKGKYLAFPVPCLREAIKVGVA